MSPAWADQPRSAPASAVSGRFSSRVAAPTGRGWRKAPAPAWKTACGERAASSAAWGKTRAAAPGSPRTAAPAEKARGSRSRATLPCRERSAAASSPGLHPATWRRSCGSRVAAVSAAADCSRRSPAAVPNSSPAGAPVPGPAPRHSPRPRFSKEREKAPTVPRSARSTSARRRVSSPERVANPPPAPASRAPAPRRSPPWRTAQVGRAGSNPAHPSAKAPSSAAERAREACSWWSAPRTSRLSSAQSATDQEAVRSAAAGPVPPAAAGARIAAAPPPAGRTGTASHPPGGAALPGAGGVAGPVDPAAQPGAGTLQPPGKRGVSRCGRAASRAARTVVPARGGSGGRGTGR